MSATPTQRTCCTCHQPIATISDSYLVTWTLNQSGPPTNIYAHRGQCAAAANRLYLGSNDFSRLGLPPAAGSAQNSPNPQPATRHPQPAQLPLL